MVTLISRLSVKLVFYHSHNVVRKCQPYVKDVRGEIQRALRELLPPGLIDVFGEVDVKYDSLLRIRYAPGILYAGREGCSLPGFTRLVTGCHLLAVTYMAVTYHAGVLTAT